MSWTCARQRVAPESGSSASLISGLAESSAYASVGLAMKHRAT